MQMGSIKCVYLHTILVLLYTIVVFLYTKLVILVHFSNNQHKVWVFYFDILVLIYIFAYRSIKSKEAN
jgi:hypothetical protein